MGERGGGIVVAGLGLRWLVVADGAFVRENFPRLERPCPVGVSRRAGGVVDCVGTSLTEKHRRVDLGRAIVPRPRTWVVGDGAIFAVADDIATRLSESKTF